MRNEPMILINEVSTFGRARQATRRQVDALSESIREVGLLNPITVAPADYGYALVAGLHRLEACKALGWVEIPAVVVELGEQQRIIAECDENLCASTLTASERAEFTRRRKTAYEALHPEAAHGSNQHTRSRQVGESSDPARFTADTAAKTGQSERVVQRDAERGEKVCDEAMALIRNTRLDTGRYLDGIKNLSPEEQVSRANADLTEPVTRPSPEPEPEDDDPAVAKVRREIARLTPAAMVDEIVGLRADLADAKIKVAKIKAEKDDLQAKWEEATQGDLGRALGNAQRRADAATGRTNELLATVKRLEFRLKKAEARVAELEDTPIQMDAA